MLWLPRSFLSVLQQAAAAGKREQQEGRRKNSFHSNLLKTFYFRIDYQFFRQSQYIIIIHTTRSGKILCVFRAENREMPCV